MPDADRMTQRLTSAEDEDLRRLAALAAFGDLGEVAAARFADLRARDRREEIREPRALVLPNPRSEPDGPLART